MPLPFSFFGSKDLQLSPASLADGAATELPGSVISEKFGGSPFGIPVSPFPCNTSALPNGESSLPLNVGTEVFESIPTVLLPELPPVFGVALPERAESLKGLAGIVIQQSDKQAPPLNRRSPFPSFPFSTLLSSPPQTSLATNSDSKFPEVAQSAFKPAEETALGIEEIRQDLHGEIEQVKNDLFGAVMGVSALKDRLDGLEEQINRILTAPPTTATAPPSKQEIEPLLISWLDAHLPEAFERMLANAQQKMLGTQGAAFFRSSVPLSETDRQSLFSQPPVILNSTPV